MNSIGLTFDSGENPLLSDSPAIWDQLIEAIGPPSIFLIIRSKMGAFLFQRMSPEDIWQEALIQVWNERKQFQWNGIKSFRNWLLKIIDNRIKDLARREKAIKRGGKETLVSLDKNKQTGSEGVSFSLPIESTTPSRVAIYQEQAEAMYNALESLPPDQREVVRLRLFEEFTMAETAAKLNITQDTAKHRFRKGCFIYERRLTAELASRSADRNV